MQKATNTFRLLEEWRDAAVELQCTDTDETVCAAVYKMAHEVVETAISEGIDVSELVDDRKEYEALYADADMHVIAKHVARASS